MKDSVRIVGIGEIDC